MAYRERERKRPIKRVLHDVATQNRTFVQNGATAHIAIPCWYVEVKRPERVFPHDREMHDHLGWPEPNRPDQSCQDAYHLSHLPWAYHDQEQQWRKVNRYLDMSKCIPIHLLEEGYSEVEVAFANPPAGLGAEGAIDKEQDWVVRFSFFPMCEDAIEEDVDVPYTVFVLNREKEMRDVVAKGVLRIVAGPLYDNGRKPQ